MKIRVLVLFGFQVIIALVLGNETVYRDCSIRLEDDSLFVENSLVKRVYSMNNGNLITKLVLNKTSGFTWKSTSGSPDMSLPGGGEPATLLSYKSYVTEETRAREAHVEAEIVFAVSGITVKRVIRLYPRSPVVGNDFFFKGETGGTSWLDRDFVDNKLSDIAVDTDFLYEPFTLFNYDYLVAVDEDGFLWSIPISTTGSHRRLNKIGSGWDRFEKLISVGSKLIAVDSDGDFYEFDFNATDYYWVLN